MNPPTITPKQAEVLYYLARACSNSEIASEMGVAISTVKLHLRSIFIRLDVNCRTRALVKAEELNLIPKKLPTTAVRIPAQSQRKQKQTSNSKKQPD